MYKLEDVNPNKLPRHIAVIMDGNGRWAKKRGRLRIFGHENGAEAVKKTIDSCAKLKIQYVTLYTFSTENWKRPKIEIDTLMKLLVTALRKEVKTLNEKNIKLKAIGTLDTLPAKAQKELSEVIAKTAKNTGMTLTLALSYGAREELKTAVKTIAHKVKNGIISPEAVDETAINANLYTHFLPDVDLLIRTSGERRISNFLLWQIAYAELYFAEVLWPDFSEHHLVEALLSYQHRERRFGKISEQLS